MFRQVSQVEEIKRLSNDSEVRKELCAAVNRSLRGSAVSLTEHKYKKLVIIQADGVMEELPLRI